MFNFLVCIIVASIAILAFEVLYVMWHMTSDIHAILFFYLLAAIINNVGYMFELTATSSATFYQATKFLYLGKIYIPVGLLIFTLRYCRIRFPNWLSYALLGLHTFFYIVIVTNDFHHLFYSSITYVSAGLFPHNVYGHGPLYFVYQSIPILYALICLVLALRQRKSLRSHAEKMQLFFFTLAPMITMVGVLIFFTGKTGGFDVSNLGYFISSICMLLALFKYKIIDTVSMVKSSLVDELKDGIIAIDPSQRVAYMNATAKKLMPGLEVGRSGAYSGLIQDMERRVKNKDKLSINGRSYSLFSQDLYQNDIYRGRFYIMDDITESEEYAREIMQEKERADSANEAKSRFLSNMSHEIRTPMNAIVGMTDIMLRDPLPPEDIGYLENIKNSGNVLLDIINDILDFSKIESGRVDLVEQEYELLPVMRELKVMFETRLGTKPIRLMYDIDENLPSVLMGDIVKIRQVVTNIVNNAIKFTDIGYIRISVSAKDIDADHIDLQISVEDSGQGIKKEEQEAIFESFSQANVYENHKKEGTGLGLAISKSFVTLMGGSISVKSEYGEGSTFSFNFPQRVIDATKATSSADKILDSTVATFTAPDLKVLLVEDNDMNVKVVKGLLKPNKLQISVANNGLEALRLISSKDYDIVFMDHMMPVMGGTEATERIRSFEDEYFKKVPIIALTANTVVGAKEKLLASGMNDFLGKPVRNTEICAMIRKWVKPELIHEGLEPASITTGNYATSASKEAPKEGSTGFHLVDGMITPESVAYVEDVEVTPANTPTGAGEFDPNFIDKATGLKYCGSEELWQTILGDFNSLIDDKSSKILELKESGNIKDYTIEVHALKSTARMIGAVNLSELAFKLEMAGKENDLKLIDEDTPKLIKLYRSYKDILSSYGSNDDNVIKKEVDTDVILAELKKMNEAVTNFDMDTVDEAMSNLKSYKMPGREFEAQIMELEKRVTDVDMDRIKEITANLLSK